MNIKIRKHGKRWMAYLEGLPTDRCLGRTPAEAAGGLFITAIIGLGGIVDLTEEEYRDDDISPAE